MRMPLKKSVNSYLLCNLDPTGYLFNMAALIFATHQILSSPMVCTILGAQVNACLAHPSDIAELCLIDSYIYLCGRCSKNDNHC